MPHSGCWPIPASVASVRAVGAAPKSPEFIEGVLPEMILPPVAPGTRRRPGSDSRRRKTRASSLPNRRAHRRRSPLMCPIMAAVAYTPAAADAVDWQRGNYSDRATQRARRQPRRLRASSRSSFNMVTEGSVLVRRTRPARCGRPMWRRKDSRIPSSALASRWPFPCSGRGPMKIPADVPDTPAGRRRAQAGAHRLHGLERPGQRARPAAHLPAACQGSAAGRLSLPAQARRQAGFRLLGRIRAELRRPPDSVRKPRLLRILEPRIRREHCSSPLSPPALPVPTCPALRSREPCAPACCSRTGATACCTTCSAR